MSFSTIRKGGAPILLIAPHGPSDIRTAPMTEWMADLLGAFAVINTGWSRGNRAEYKKGVANCNDLDHCRKEPLLSEFLGPIHRCKDVILSRWGRANLFLIHGIDDTVRDYMGVDVVVGYGNGNPPRHSCTHTFRNRLLSALSLEGFNPACGKSGGRLSAWSSKNLNQMFVTDNRVESVQVEMVLSLRDSDGLAVKTARRLAMVIDKTCKSTTPTTRVGACERYL